MQEWYLIDQNPPSAISTYEDDYFDEWAQESFLEICRSFVSEEVIIYNHDLTEQKTVRGIPQNQLADTSLKSFQRLFLFPLHTAHAGMYVFYDNNYWIITSVVDDNKMYQKVISYLCQYYVKWQDIKTRKIIGRWAYDLNTTQYNTGETTDPVMYTAMSQHTITVPTDEYTIRMDTPLRIMMDLNKENPTVYKVTSNDTVANWFGYCGVCKVTLQQDKFDHSKDNIELGICDYIDENGDNEIPENPTQDYCKIQYTTLRLKTSGTRRKFTARFYSANGEELSVSQFNWSIKESYENLHISKDGDSIYLWTTDESLIGNHISLTLSSDGLLEDQVSILIEGVY